MKEVKENFQKSVFNKRVTVIGLGKWKSSIDFSKSLGAIVYVSDSGHKKITSNALELMNKYHIASETGIHSNKIYDSDLWIIFQQFLLIQI